MSGNLGPSFYLPDPSQTNASPSAGWGQGISSIAQALFPNPTAMAEARLRGAQTQQIQQGLQVGQTAIGARGAMSHFLANPNALGTPEGRAYYQSQITLLPPDEQAQARSNISTAVANSSMTQADKDAFNASAGFVPMESTPTGFGRKMQNQIQVATIGAGPGYAQAAAERYAADVRSKTELAVAGGTPTNVVPTGGGPAVVLPRSQATSGKYGPYEPSVDIAQHAPVNVQPLGGGPPVTVTTQESTTGKYGPVLSNDQLTASATQDAARPNVPSTPLPPSHGSSPGDATQPGATGNSATVAAAPAAADGSPQPSNWGQRVLGVQQRTAVPEEKPDWNALTVGVEKKNLGTTTIGTDYKFGPRARGALLTTAQQYYANPSYKSDGTYGNAAAAIQKAYNDVIAPFADKMSFSSHPFERGVSPDYEYSPDFTPPGPAPPTTALPPTAAPTTTVPQTPLVPSAKAAIPTPQQGPQAASQQAPQAPIPTAPKAGENAPISAKALKRGQRIGSRIYRGPDTSGMTDAEALAAAKNDSNWIIAP